MATYDKETIIRYVDDELPPEERQEFEAALQTDASLAAETTLYRELRDTLADRLPADKTREALQETLRGMNTRYFTAEPATGDLANSTADDLPAQATGESPVRATDEPPVRALPPLGPQPRADTAQIHALRKRPLRKYWPALPAVAAAIVLLLVLFPLRRSATLDQLGRTEMVGATERGDDADSLLGRAAVYFNAQQFDKALPYLDRAVKADSASQLALFYRGVAEGHLGQTAASRADLEKVYEGGSALQYEAAFYMALGYARENDKATALSWLKKIPPDAPVAEKARALAQKLQ